MKMTEAIINSMTPGERRNPDILNASRRRRIARGSGTDVQDVNRLIKQFREAQKMFKTITKDRRARNAAPVWLNRSARPGGIRVSSHVPQPQNSKPEIKTNNR